MKIKTNFIMFCVGVIALMGLTHLSFAQSTNSYDMNEVIDTELLEYEADLESEFQQETVPKVIIIDILEVQDMGINDVLELIEIKSDIRINAPRGLPGKVSIYLQDVDVRDALRIVLDTNSLAYYEKDDVYHVITSRDFQTLFGHRFGQKVQTRVVPLLHTTAEDTIKFLREIKSASGRIVYNEGTNAFLITDAPDKLDTMEEFIKARDVQTQTKSVTLSYADPEIVLKEVQRVLTAGIGRAVLDEDQKNLTVTDTSLKLDEIVKLVEEMDRQEHQFVVETKTIQITLNDEHTKGVDWEAIVSKYKSMSFKEVESGDQSGQPRVLHMGILSKDDVVVLLEALDTVGIVNTIGESRFDVPEGTEMKVDVKYMEDSADGKSDNRFETEEIRYYLRPKILVEEEVDLRIRPEFTLPDKYQFGRRVTSAETFGVTEGSTLIIGGLFKDIKVESLWKIPLLGDLPILGFAFRNQYKQIRKTEVIMLITPQLKIKDNENE